MAGNMEQIEQRRRELLREMESIRSMERATFKEQMLRVKLRGETKPVLRGPYYVLARWENGKTCSRRVRAHELEQVKRDVANHERFKTLCKEFESLTQRLGKLEREQAVSDEAVKKGLMSRSSKARKSRE